MKTLFIFSAGSIANFIIAEIAAHPQIIDVILGILVGALFALLMAVIFVGPSKPKQKQETQKPTTQKSNKPRKPKEKSIIAKATDYELFPVSVRNMPAIAI